MKKRGKMKRMISGVMAAITLLSTVLSPITGYAEGNSRPPLYEDVKDQLDADEIVTASDYELEYGSSFDAEEDFSNIEIPDSQKVKVTFAEAKNASGDSFSSTQADTYKAVYYVEPLTTDHPKYRISRNLIVREAESEIQTNPQTEDHSENPDEETGDDAEEDSQTVETTESEDSSEVLSEEELDKAIEEAESQDTYDEETGLDLTTVMETAVEDEVDFLGLEEGETIEFEVEVSNLKARATTETVSITRGSWYYYSSYGLGTYHTAPYYVEYGSISATAYCVQPSKTGPDDGTYSITKLGDSKTLAKVCYYGTKASGDEGFFKEKYPDFSAGKRFIITHMAASYANGSSDAFSGTNSTGKDLAMELYNYCVSQPEIPEVAMSFSKDSVTAYIDGKNQRTEEVTFKADELQTITFNLPSGVKLHNTTTGKTSAAGASVEICGGTKFYLSAPLTQAEDVSAKFSTKMKGSITKDYSAYKISTGSTQDLAFVFGEGVTDEKYVTFSVSWQNLATVEIVKKDSGTGTGLAGAVYGIYSDKDCTDLIKKMPATDSKGASSATITKTQDTVYLKEITAPTGYLIDTKSYGIKVEIGETTAKTVSDDMVDASIRLVKKDKETGSVTQGDAVFTGAVYGLYAREDISHPDGKTGLLYKKDELVTTMTVDASGNAKAENLYLGKYYIKEITAPTGYLLDEEKHNVDFTYEGDSVNTVERTVVSSEQVIKQPFQLIKVANNGKTDADLLSGAGFSAYLVSSLTKNADGSYDFSSADPVVITADGKTEMFTDETGYACSIALPYGTYIVRETTTPHNYTPVDDFVVTITENKPSTPQVWRVLLDDEFEAKLKIVKKDAETGKSVLLANTEFKVYDLDNEKYVEQVTTYPKVVTHKSYFTDEEGYLILPKNLKIGNYRIEEVTAPNGYTINNSYVTVKVDSNTAYQMDSASGDAIITVEYENQPVKGKLTVWKEGEVLVGFADGAFQYETARLSGAVFEVSAAEDIYTPDHQKDEDGNRVVIYTAGTVVATITTDDTGKASAENLPLGTYTVKEVTAPDGFTLNAEAQNVTFTYADQYTPVVEQELTFENDRQKAAVNVVKKEKDVDRTLAGAVFGLYAGEDIKTASGEVVVEKDALIEQEMTDENGQLVFSADIPLGFGYYVQEISAPDGFVTTNESQTFLFEYVGADQAVVTFGFTFENEPTTVELTKTDLTTGEELPGAHLQVVDENGNVVDEWVSTEEAHVIRELTVGKTYTMVETLPADGYVTAESVAFTIENTAEIQKWEMQDDVTKVQISKTDITGEQEVPGAKLTILDENDQVVESWTSTNEPHYVEKLPIGSYTLREEQAPKGYVLTADISFEVADTGEIQTVQITNETAKGRVIINKTDKDSGKPLEGVEFELRDSAGNVMETLKTDSAGHAESSLYEIASYEDGVYCEPLKYYLVETKALDGYTLDSTEHEVTFEYVDDATSVIEVTFDLKNEKQEKHSGNPKTGDETNLWIPILLMAVSVCGMAALVIRRRKK